MGYVLTRRGKDGKPRYTAVYRDIRGRKRSAGTFATEREANKEWQKAEVKLAEGRIGDPRRGRQTFRRYVLDEWLPNHVMEASTRESYTYQLGKHILGWFGPLRMNEILPSHVREWVTHLKGQGVTPTTIRTLKAILSGIFTTALNDQVTFLHPCKGVKTPTVADKPLTIVTPGQFDTVYRALPDPGTRLLVELAIESGLRWGELTELRPTDLNLTTGILTVSRVVIQVNPKFHPEGRRFLVKDYPKGKKNRRLKLSAQIAAKIKRHISDNGLDPRDLLFTYRESEQPAHHIQGPAHRDPGFTKPNTKGHRYRHGTLSAYNAGPCRCQNCKAAFATYRAGRRSNGKDESRSPRIVDTDGHIPRKTFRDQLWAPALEAAELGFHVRVHDLRHAHASWLLAGGADLETVKERLGHASIAITQKYLHTLPDADDTALAAFAKTRNGASEPRPKAGRR